MIVLTTDNRAIIYRVGNNEWWISRVCLFSLRYEEERTVWPSAESSSVFDGKKQTIYNFQKHVVNTPRCMCACVTRIFTYIFGNDTVGEGTLCQVEWTKINNYSLAGRPPLLQRASAATARWTRTILITR